MVVDVTRFFFQVVRINRQFNVIYVRGAVPGHKNTFVRVTDAKRKPHTSPPPFPTYFPELDLEARDEEEFSSVQHPYDNSLYFPNKYTDKWLVCSVCMCVGLYDRMYIRLCLWCSLWCMRVSIHCCTASSSGCYWNSLHSLSFSVCRNLGVLSQVKYRLCLLTWPLMILIPLINWLVINNV